MNKIDAPVDDAALVAAVEQQLAEVQAARRKAADRLSSLDLEQAALGHHPNYPAYIHGGMLAEQGFGAGHVLPVLGFHTLGVHEAVDRLASVSDLSERTDLFGALRTACETDPMLELAGEQFAAEHGLLKRGRIDPLWIRRPKLGLGQAAKTFGLEPEHAGGHRGLYDLSLSALDRLLVDARIGQADQRFGALLLPAIIHGGEQLAAAGAAAFHRDAEARYREDCRRFAEHQQTNPSRRWRWKPPLSRQGHLAITTARTKGIDLPAARTRGHAANWLSDQNANLRFNEEDRS